jgi:spore coat polysaccharide biosynthesis predicted glycosyltransferase SpsG
MEYRIVFRVAGGHKMGMGHIERCRSLAEHLINRHILNLEDMAFVVNGDQVAIQKLRKSGFSIISLPKDLNGETEKEFQKNIVQKLQPKIIVVDVPPFPERDVEFFKSLRTTNGFILNINSLNSGRFEADAIVEGGIANYMGKYGEIEKTKDFLLGSQYAILNEVFAEFHRKARGTRDTVKKVLLSFGGSDPSNLTLKCLEALLFIDFRNTFCIDMVLGASYKAKTEIKSMADESDLNIQIHNDILPREMATLMMEADIGIITGGLTLYEAASIGLPVIVINTNPHDNVRGGLSATEFERRGYGLNLTIPDRKGQEEISNAFSRLFHDKELRAEFTKRGKELVDGEGIIRIANFVERVLEEVEKKC